MNKALLVAQREFVENMRTKTFWIGILSFPILIVLFVFGARLLEKTKDVRSYTIFDRSPDQWLSAAIEARAARTDLRTLGEAALHGDAEDQAAARRRYEEWYATIPDDHPLKDLERRLQPFMVDIDLQQVMAGDSQGIPAEAQREVFRWMLEVMRDPKKRATLASIASSISLARYRRMTLDELGIDPEARDVEKELNARVNDGRLFAYFVVPENPVESDKGSLYVSNNLTDSSLRQWLENHTTEVVRDKRIAGLELSKEQATSIRETYDFAKRRVTETGEAEVVSIEEEASSFAPVAFVYLLWIAVFTAAQMLLTNTVEEKSNRLIEVLLSSVSPMQLMAGKVIGIAATGLTIVLSWVVSALIGVQFVPGGSALGGADLAAIIGDPLYLTSFVGYFLAGYLLYAAFLVAIGSVCDSLKEAQNLMQPVFIVLIVPLIAMMFVVRDPNGTTARVLTYIPLFTPFLMMNRAGGPPPVSEYVLSSLVIVVSLIIAFWGAAKIFRIGILMTGKPPKITEILRWLRAPVGAVHVKRDAGPNPRLPG